MSISTYIIIDNEQKYMRAQLKTKTKQKKNLINEILFFQSFIAVPCTKVWWCLPEKKWG